MMVSIDIVPLSQSLVMYGEPDPAYVHSPHPNPVLTRSADPPILFQDMYPSLSHVDVDGPPVFCSNP